MIKWVLILTFIEQIRPLIGIEILHVIQIHIDRGEPIIKYTMKLSLNSMRKQVRNQGNR
jgi:hypothetical protein